MEIKQFEDKNLAHYSYAIYSGSEIALIDPSRDPSAYYQYAKDMNAKITAIIETHPHADFVSSHLEIHQETGANIYAHSLLSAEYPHHTFDEGERIKLGQIELLSIHTPGHSPDSISILAFDEAGNQKAVFTGDSLFIGDCGRPDLRENAGAITSGRFELAKQMYHTLRDKFLPLHEDVLVYPAHGAGSLCGKGLSEQNSSTIGDEKRFNWSLGEMTEDHFVEQLLADQPFIPKYFGYNVALNRKGADSFQASISKVEVLENADEKVLDPSIVLIDTRPQIDYKRSHSENSINLMDDLRFETWLGSIVEPGEKFYLLGASKEVLHKLISRISKIGYEGQIVTAIVSNKGNGKMKFFDSVELREQEKKFTILDIRNVTEVQNNQIFKDSINIPLHQLRERIGEIPVNKPILVHCAGGYRSAAGSSILQSKLKDKTEVFDLSEEVKNFQK